MEMFLGLIAFHGGGAYLGYKIAGRKGVSTRFWMHLCFYLPPLALILYTMPDTIQPEDYDIDEDTLVKAAEYQNRPREEASEVEHLLDEPDEKEIKSKEDEDHYSF